MLNLNDPKWSQLKGGYRIEYDASESLRKLEQANNQNDIDEVMSELWDELHHQGDVDLASYYAVPHLIRIAKSKPRFVTDIIAIAITIEIERHRNNPSLPTDLVGDYQDALRELGELAIHLINQPWELTLASIALSAIAVSKNQVGLARAISLLEDESILEEFLDTY